MGEPTVDEKEKRKQDADHKQDRADFGDVENVSDLEPYDSGGKHLQKQQQGRILDANANGYFEIEGGAIDGLGAPLHLDPHLSKAVPRAKDYELGYNAYARPLRSSLRSLGRVKDVALTGAPMTPAALKQKPELAARFKRLGANAGKKDMDNWALDQSQLKLQIKAIGSGQHELNSALAGYRKVQLMLEQKQVEAKKAAKQKELHEITEAAETLAKIADVSLEAYGAINEIEEWLDKKPNFNENAEGDNPADVDKQPQHNKDNTPNYADGGTDDDPYGEKHAEKHKPSATKQKVGELVDASSFAASGVARVKAQVVSQVQKSGEFSLSFDGLFTALIGGKRFGELTREIAALEGKLKILHIDEEMAEIRSANERLRSVQLSFKGTSEKIQLGRTAARMKASAVADTVGGGAETTMVTYAAEAYQELAQFGAEAAAMRKEMVDPLWSEVYLSLSNTSMQRLQVDKEKIVGPAKTLATNLQEVAGQRDYFNKHVPEWQDNAKRWSDFFKEQTGQSLIVAPGAADKRSAAP